MQGWKNYELKELVTLSKEKYNPKKEKENVPCIELEHLESNTGKLIGYTDSLSQESIKNKFYAGNVLYGKLRPYLKKYYFPNFDGVCSSEIWVLQNDESKIYNKYLYYLIQTNRFNENANKSTGTKMPRADWSIVSEIIFPIPPLKEQQKIAAILSTVDKVIELKEKLIEQKKQQKKGLMQKLLTGKMRLPGFKSDWKTVQLGDIAEIYQPKTISQSEMTDSGYPVYGANGLIGYYNQYNHETWQIMITCRGSTCGTVNKTEGKAWITGNAMVVNADNSSNIDKDFLYYLCLMQNYKKIIGGSGQPQITKKPLEEFNVSIPLDIKEQKQLAKIFLMADNEIHLLIEELNEIKAQKLGLLQLLLTGKVRVQV